MKVLLTGGTGFIGKNLIPHLKHFDLAIITREKKSIEGYTSIIYNEDNLNDFARQVEIFKPQIVIHLAGNSSSEESFVNSQNLIKANILFGTHLLIALSNCKISTFINAGTCLSHYDNPQICTSTNLYAATKSAFKNILDYYSELYKFNFINLILYNVYGTGDRSKRAINYIIDSIESSCPVNMSPGEQHLDLIHVNDVVEIILKILTTNKTIIGKFDIHVGTGISYSLKDVANIIEKITFKKLNINWGGRKYRSREKMLSKAPLELNDNFLNWKAKTTLENGLKDILIQL